MSETKSVRFICVCVCLFDCRVPGGRLPVEGVHVEAGRAPVAQQPLADLRSDTGSGVGVGGSVLSGTQKVSTAPSTELSTEWNPKSQY